MIQGAHRMTFHDGEYFDTSFKAEEGTEKHVWTRKLKLGLERIESLRGTTTPTLILVILEEKDSGGYSEVKRWGDSVVGAPIVLRHDKFQRNAARTLPSLRVNIW